MIASGRAVFLVQRTQERGRRDLAGLVNPDRQRILLGNRALNPAPSLRDNPEPVQRAVAFLLFDEEVNARRTVQLIHNDALGAIDDELAARRS